MNILCQTSHTITSEDLEKGFIKKDFKIPYAKLQDCEVFRGWEEDSTKEKESKGLMVLEVVRKWEYRGGGNNNADNWATISEFTLKLNNEIVKDSNNQEIKGYIVEPAGMNPNLNKPADEQQKTAGSDTRIPTGEYEIFWRHSNSTISADESYIKKIGISNFNKKIVPELRAINGTDIGSRGGILIHTGNTGKDSLGCLMPNKYRKQDANKHYNGGSGSQEMTKQLITAIIKHDSQSYINANNKQKGVVVKNFKILIREENIEINPKEQQ